MPVLPIALYALAGLLLLYTVWAASQSFGYISQMVAHNQLVIKGNEFDIARFHMANFVQYGLLAAILFALGRILHTSSAGGIRPAGPRQKAANASSEQDDFEGWFEDEPGSH